MSVTHSVHETKVLVDKIALIGLQPGRIVDVIGVNLDRTRWAYEARAETRYVELRSYPSGHMRELVLSDPSSEFFGRDLTPPRDH